MEISPLANPNGSIDYSDNHQVIKALVERDIPEKAAEILLDYAKFQNQVIQQENHSRFAPIEKLNSLQLLQKNNEEAHNKLATKDDVKLTKLELRREIEDVRKETEALRKETEALRKETEALRKETEALRKETEALRKETEAIRRETEALRERITEVELKLTREIEVVRREIVQYSRKTILWLSSILLANTGLLGGLMFVLFKMFAGT